MFLCVCMCACVYVCTCAGGGGACVCVCVCVCQIICLFLSTPQDFKRLRNSFFIFAQHKCRFAVPSMDDFNDKAKDDFNAFLAIDDPAETPIRVKKQKEQRDTSSPAVDTVVADSSTPSLGTFAKGSYATFFHNKLIQHLLRGESIEISCSVFDRFRMLRTFSLICQLTHMYTCICTFL